MKKSSDRFVTPRRFPDRFLYFGNPFIGIVDSMIKQRGIRVEMYPSLSCPCSSVNEHGGMGYPAPHCVDCGGYGLVFMQEPRRFRALFSGADAIEQRLPTGFVGSGRATITVPSGEPVSPGDKFVFPDVRISIPIIRIYHAMDGGIPIPFQVVGLEEAIIKPRNPEIPATWLKEGRDFGYDEKNRILYFTANGAVRDGMGVSISLIGIPEYIVDTIPSMSRQIMTDIDETKAKVIELPKSVTALRSDLFFGSLDVQVAHNVG